MASIAARALTSGITALTAALIIGGGTAHAEPQNPHDTCVIDAHNDTKTVNSLMNHCGTEQILDFFAGAPLGEAPTGRKNISLLPVFQIDGDPLPYDDAQRLTRAQSTLGKTLTFTTKGDAAWVYKDYFFGRDIGAQLHLSVSRTDGKPAWTADFADDFNGAEISLHEYRQLTPGVWIGRDIGGGSEPTDTPTGGVIALS